MAFHIVLTGVPFDAVRTHNAEAPHAERLVATGPSYKLSSDSLPAEGSGVFAQHHYLSRPSIAKAEALQLRLGAAAVAVSEV